MIEVLNPLTMSDWMRLQVTRSRKIGNALNGATFISTIIRVTAEIAVSNCVNALNGATFISTRIANKRKGVILLCQCPEWGDLHFH